MGTHPFWEVKIPSDSVIAIPFLSPSIFYIIPKYPLYRHSGASRNQRVSHNQRKLEMQGNGGET